MYTLPQHIDTNKIFIVNRSELEDRFDAQFYKEAFNFDSFSKLSKYVFVKGGKRIPLGMDYANAETPYLYLRVVDINNDNNVKYDTLKFIDQTVFDTLERYEINENDLAISIAGTIGKTILLKNIPAGKRVILTENCAKILIKDNNIIPDFFELVLNLSIVQKQIELNYIQTTIPKLGLDRINNLKLPPFPDKSIQQQIVKIYQTAYQQKQQKEAQAQKLLASIDDYLLSELGIVMPEENEINEPVGFQDFNLNSQNPLVKNGRLFLTRFAKITNGRIDAEYQSTYYKQLIKAIQNSGYLLLNLNDVTNIITSGKTPASSEYSDRITPFPIIKVGSYTNDYVDLEKCSYTQKEQFLEINKGDIFILSAAHQAEYVGKHIKYLNENPKIKTSYVGELICVRTNAKYNSLFLFSLLQTKIYKELINREKTGQTSHIYGKDIKFLKVPNIPLKKQNEIASHISTVRQQAQQLQSEAVQALQQAKEKIEQMILG